MAYMIPYIVLAALIMAIIPKMAPGISPHQKVEPLGNTQNMITCHSPDPTCVWLDSNHVSQTESKLNIRHCNSAYGKTPGMWSVTSTTHNMEVEGAGIAAADRLIEFLAIVMMMLTILTLTLAILLIMCWACNRAHIRDYVMRWATGQRSNRLVAVPNMHFVSTFEHEGEADNSEHETMSDTTMSEDQVSRYVPEQEEQVQPQDSQ